MKAVIVAAIVAIGLAVTMPASAATKKTTAKPSTSCPCSGTKLCTGPRGGRYCYSATGRKQYQR